MQRLFIYTDGGCHGNPGPGAWAYRIVDADGRVTAERSGFSESTTNNRMELMAVISALEAVSTHGTAAGAVAMITDSEYVRQGITSWIDRWRANGWRTAAKKPVKNRELWERLDSIAHRVKPSWQWVRGHAGDEHNEACDALVQQTIRNNNGKS